MPLNRPITGINKYPFIIPIQGICIPPANIFVANNTIYINENINISSIPYCLYTGMSTIQINSGYTSTVDINFTLPSNITTITGSGTLSINSGITLIINTNTIFTISTVSGAGTLSISSGYRLTIGANTTFTVSTVSGAGTLSVNSGCTLTIGANATFTVPTISGAGTLSVNSACTLTQGVAVTISVANITVAGTWANAGYGITIPSGSSVTWNITGSLTTTSTPGTMTVNGTVYWYGNNIYPFTMAGTGIYLGSPSSSAGTATATISLSNTSIDPIDYDGSATGTGKVTYYKLTSVSGSATGEYYLSLYDKGKDQYPILVTIYIGTANKSYSISGIFNANYTDSTDTVYVWNGTNSVGAITLTGTAYV